MNPDGTQDVNTVSLYETSSEQTVTLGVVDGSNGTAALKITSKAKNVTVSSPRLIGGSENCVDLNNECAGISVSCPAYEVRGKYAISAKTCSGVTFGGHLIGHGSQWDVNLGSWSDQSSATQTGTHLALTAESYPITVWLGNSDMASFDDPTKYKVIGFGRFGPLVRSIVMFLWSVAKKLHLA